LTRTVSRKPDARLDATAPELRSDFHVAAGWRVDGAII
jgi:hypothetical protein